MPAKRYVLPVEASFAGGSIYIYILIYDSFDAKIPAFKGFDFSVAW